MPDQYPHADASQAVHAASPGPPPQFPQQPAFQIPGGQHISSAMQMGPISPDTPVVVPANLLWSLMNQPGMSIAMPVPQFHQMPMAMAQGTFPQQGVQLISSGLFPQNGFAPQGVYPHQTIGMSMSQPTDAQSSLGAHLLGSASPGIYPQKDDGISGRRLFRYMRTRFSSCCAESYRGSPMDQDETPSSLKRKVRPSDSSASGFKKKKEKARERRRPSKHARLSDSYDEVPLPFTNSSPLPASQRHQPTSDQVEGLFTKDDGTPYAFFVQIETRNRTKLADSIKVRRFYSCNSRTVDEQRIVPEKRREDSFRSSQSRFRHLSTPQPEELRGMASTVQLLW